MRRKRKPPGHMRKKKNPLILPRVRFNLTWASKAAAMARDEPLVLVAPDVVHRDNGGQPFPREHDAKGMHGWEHRRCEERLEDHRREKKLAI